MEVDLSRRQLFSTHFLDPSFLSLLSLYLSCLSLSLSFPVHKGINEMKEDENLLVRWTKSHLLSLSLFASWYNVIIVETEMWKRRKEQKLRVDFAFLRSSDWTLLLSREKEKKGNRIMWWSREEERDKIEKMMREMDGRGGWQMTDVMCSSLFNEGRKEKKFVKIPSLM